jgi:hypothetical protein
VAITAPVPRPTHHLSGDGPTAEWHSRATLGLVRSSPVHIGKQSGTPTLLSLAAPNDGFTHRRLLRARSPFTRSCRCFCSAITELIRDQTPPNDFCNCLRRAGNQTLRLSLTSQGRWPRPSSFSYSPRLLPYESGGERRAARRSPRRPRCWFIPLARVCPAAIPPRAPRHRRFYPDDA